MDIPKKQAIIKKLDELGFLDECLKRHQTPASMSRLGIMLWTGEWASQNVTKRGSDVTKKPLLQTRNDEKVTYQPTNPVEPARTLSINKVEKISRTLNENGLYKPVSDPVLAKTGGLGFKQSDEQVNELPESMVDLNLIKNKNTSDSIDASGLGISRREITSNEIGMLDANSSTGRSNSTNLAKNLVFSKTLIGEGEAQPAVASVKNGETEKTGPQREVNPEPVTGVTPQQALTKREPKRGPTTSSSSSDYYSSSSSSRSSSSSSLQSGSGKSDSEITLDDISSDDRENSLDVPVAKTSDPTRKKASGIKPMVVLNCPSKWFTNKREKQPENKADRWLSKICSKFASLYSKNLDIHVDEHISSQQIGTEDRNDKNIEG